MIKLIEGKRTVFTYSLEIEGATILDTTSRIFLSRSDGSYLAYDAEIDLNGEAKVVIPSLDLTGGERGTFILEVTARKLTFQVYTSDYAVSSVDSVDINTLPTRENTVESVLEGNTTVSNAVVDSDTVIELGRLFVTGFESENLTNRVLEYFENREITDEETIQSILSLVKTAITQ